MEYIDSFLVILQEIKESEYLCQEIIAEYLRYAEGDYGYLMQMYPYQHMQIAFYAVFRKYYVTRNITDFSCYFYKMQTKNIHKYDNILYILNRNRNDAISDVDTLTQSVADISLGCPVVGMDICIS